MGQPVKLSDALVMEARLVGEVMERSIAGQIEFWANLGRRMEQVMTGEQMLQHGKDGIAARLSEALENVNKPEGRARMQAYLETRPFPRFWAHPVLARVFIREEEGGTKTVGRFVGRTWTVVDPPGLGESPRGGAGAGLSQI
jgi:hypothetical protein